jgi:NAD(P)H-nitrite reductase large subunit
VKSRAILAAIADGARSTEAVGARLNAGTNCGSCLPELRRMIVAARTQDMGCGSSGLASRSFPLEGRLSRIFERPADAGPG